MDMRKSVSETEDLIEQTETSLEEMSDWTWSDLLSALKQNQDLSADAFSSGLVQRCLNTLVGKLTLPAETSPCTSTSSPDSFGFRLSCDSRSTESLRTNSSRANWWFDDLLVLNENFIDMAVKSMVSLKLDHGTISRFLFHYQKSKFVHAQSDEKCRILEMVVDNLCSLDQCAVPIKNLMGILRTSLIYNINEVTRSRLETMIGSRLDEATLDNLLVPSQPGLNYLYDVNLILRFLKSFLSEGVAKLSKDRIIRVAELLDLYLAEVAPDPRLKPSKFIALATALPDSFRDSYDEMYHAMDMYLEVHTDLSEEEIFNICSALNYEKLSQEACFDLSKNAKFPSRSTVQALLSQQTKLKSLVDDASHPKSRSSSPYYSYGGNGAKSRNDEQGEQLVLYAEKIDNVSDDDMIRAQLQGMQCKVTEWKKICQRMQNHVARMMRSKSSSNINGRSLHRLCS